MLKQGDEVRIKSLPGPWNSRNYKYVIGKIGKITFKGRDCYILDDNKYRIGFTDDNLELYFRENILLKQIYNN